MRTKGIAFGPGVAALLLALALFPAAASARLHRGKTKLNIDALGAVYPGGDYDWLFAGFLDVKPLNLHTLWCVVHRNVRIFRDEPTGPDTLIGSRRSDDVGEALIFWHHPDLAEVPGDYYAKARPLKTHHPGGIGTTKCSGARSPTLTINAPQLHPVGSGDAGAARVLRRPAR